MMTRKDYDPRLVDACKQAIEAYSDEDHARRIDLPWGDDVAATTIVDGLHLEAFLA